MTTESPSAVRRRGLEQWAVWGVIAYVVLFIAGAASRSAVIGIVHATLALVSISINAAIKTMSAIHSATPSPPSSSTRRTMSAT